LGDYTNILVNGETAATANSNLKQFVENTIYNYLVAHGVDSRNDNLARLGGEHLIIADQGVHYTFTNGLLTDAYLVNNE
jgi:hypothetical protein